MSEGIRVIKMRDVQYDLASSNEVTEMLFGNEVGYNSSRFFGDLQPNSFITKQQFQQNAQALPTQQVPVAAGTTSVPVPAGYSKYKFDVFYADGTWQPGLKQGADPNGNNVLIYADAPVIVYFFG